MDALAAQYPDAVIVQTHRDPLKVIASVSALGVHLRQLASTETTLQEAAEQYSVDIIPRWTAAWTHGTAAFFRPSRSSTCISRNS